MKITVSTTSGFESILKKEIERIWWKITESKDKIITFEWDLEKLYDINLWSRVWNKVYICASEWKAKTFDDLYDLVSKIEFKNYFPAWARITVKAKSIKSDLEAVSSIQSISKKAISDNIAWKWNFMREVFGDYEVMILIQNDIAKILINTSWDALHKRGYRKVASEAPLKESLAAWIVLLSGWKFKTPLLDPFCWSWTILIEAWMIAKNIAPWILWREFLFEKMSFHKEKLFNERKEIAEGKIFDWDYKIFGSDIDSEVIEIARDNIKKAWLSDIIEVKIKDACDFEEENIEWSLITNPPYWERIWEDDAEMLHKLLHRVWEKNSDLNLNIYTWFSDANDILKSNDYKLRKLYNWGLLCNIYKKK
jgi:putative N6-adenine-specific DNA methylase